jgi:hypothetical protein
MSFIESVSKSGSWETTSIAHYAIGRTLSQKTPHEMTMYGWYDLLKSQLDGSALDGRCGCLLGWDRA